jgi:hypothetical protein
MSAGTLDEAADAVTGISQVAVVDSGFVQSEIVGTPTQRPRFPAISNAATAPKTTPDQ